MSFESPLVLEEYIKSRQPVETHDILASISYGGIAYGKQVYQKMKKDKIHSHEYFAENACGYTNYSLYYSNNTNQIYCIHTGCQYGKNSFIKYAIIEDESIFDKYMF
jgi:hypothetical protein